MYRLNHRALFSTLAIALAFIRATWITATFATASSLAIAEGTSTKDAAKIDLFRTLSLAKSEQEGRAAESQIWECWFDQSPTAEVRASLDAGIERRESYDYEAAEHHFDKVIELAPEYAEGYNQRAFIRFLRQNYESSKTDLEVVLKMEPNHFGALSGLYHILQIQNRPKAAFGMLQQAVAIHPWIQERSALPKELWPRNYRNIHDPGNEI